MTAAGVLAQTGAVALQSAGCHCVLHRCTREWKEHSVSLKEVLVEAVEWWISLNCEPWIPYFEFSRWQSGRYAQSPGAAHWSTIAQCWPGGRAVRNWVASWTSQFFPWNIMFTGKKHWNITQIITIQTWVFGTTFQKNKGSEPVIARGKKTTIFSKVKFWVFKQKSDFWKTCIHHLSLTVSQD